MKRPTLGIYGDDVKLKRPTLGLKKIYGAFKASYSRVEKSYSRFEEYLQSWMND